MTRQDLDTLLDFHYWARDIALDAAGRLAPDQWTRDMGSSFRSVRDTLVHLYSAEWNWLLRMQGTSPTSMLDAATYPDVATLAAAWTAHERSLRAFVGEADDIQRVYEYRTLTGQPGASSLVQIVTHLVNHGSYHRGQVTTLLRQLGAAGGRQMDLIAFYRERPSGRASVSG